MLKIEVTNEDINVEAEGKPIELLYQSTMAIAGVIEMVNKHFGEDMPFLEEFITTKAQEIAKDKKDEKEEKHTEKKSSEKHSDNPIDILRKILQGMTQGGDAK